MVEGVLQCTGTASAAGGRARRMLLPLARLLSGCLRAALQCRAEWKAIERTNGGTDISTFHANSKLPAGSLCKTVPAIARVGPKSPGF